MPQDNQEDAELRPFWRQYAELINRELQPFSESTDAVDQKLVAQLRKSEDALKRRLPRMRLGTASRTAQEFVASIRAYGRARRRLEIDLPRYEESVERLRLPSSLRDTLIESLQTRVTSGIRTRPPAVRPQSQYPLTEEEKGALRQYAVEVTTDLLTQPNSPYGDGWVPTFITGDALASKVFGGNYRDKNRHHTVAMMLGNKPQLYGLEKRRDTSGKTYVRPLRQ